MDCLIRTCAFICSLYLVLSIFHVEHLDAIEAILKEDTCSNFFSASVKGVDTAPGWSSPDRSTCSICNSLNTKKSWLVTKRFNKGEYKKVHVEVHVVRAECDKCRNDNIGVYIYYKTFGNDKKQNIEILDKLPLLKTLDLQNISIENETLYKFEFEPKSPQMAIVFLSRGSCTRIGDFKVYSYYCEETFSKGIKLPQTISPASGSVRVNVSCPDDVLNPENKKPYGMCNTKGKWDVVSPCMCKRGHTPSNEGEGCTECLPNTYKDVIGNDSCISCPKNSHSGSGELRCQCNDGFYHYNGDDYRQDCYGVPSKVTNIKYADKTESSIRILWGPPVTSLGSLLYDIECKKCGSSKDSSPCDKPCGDQVTFIPSQKNLGYTNVTVEKLEPNTDYQFKIYAKNQNSRHINKTKWVYEVKKITTEAVSTESGFPMAVIIAVPVVVVIMIIIIIVLAICLIKRRKGLRYRRSMKLGGHSDIPLMPGEKNYIDPSTYDNPERAVMEFTKELDRNLIKFEAIIGGGEFGDVYKGEIKLPGHPATKVAIKTLKSSTRKKDRTDFLIEASVMGQFKNLNVITLEGVVTKSTPLLIVIEYMENGSLDKYLKNNDGLLKPSQLLEMARGVASGMEYLAGMHFVHRDLAARNILVNANLTCKVADFGLSRDIGKNEDSEYETQGGKIPVRWTAPEAITFRKFSTASDVWSYGILLWEIMSFAERPYWNWGNEEVMSRVDQGGYRLPPPMNCPKIVHQLMQECWLKDRTKRPPFKEIVRILDEWIKSPEKLNDDYIKVRRAEPLDYSTFTSVGDWLEAIKMGIYASNFSKAGYEELSDVAKLTEDELLKKIGVRLVGHRHKIYQQLKEMSEQMNIKREQSVRI